MERTQFTFYASFYEAISRIRKKQDKADAYEAICAYALFGKEPDLDTLPDSVAVIFSLAKPNLDASIKKSLGGQRGGQSKHTGSIPEASPKQGETASEKEEEEEEEDKKENECSTPKPPNADGEASPKQDPLYDPDVAKVMSAYMDKINPTPSSVCTSELLDYLKDLDADVICHAIDVSVDDNKRAWSYVRAILTRFRSQSIRTMEDVRRSEAEYQAGKSDRSGQKGRYGKPATVPDSEDVQRQKLEQMRAMAAKMAEADS